jgi:hypothetical protein
METHRPPGSQITNIQKGISNIQQGISNDQGVAPFALNIGYSLLAIGNCNGKTHPMKTRFDHENLKISQNSIPLVSRAHDLPRGL